MPNDSKLHFRCPFCAKSVGVPVQFAGKRGKCPGCGNLILILHTPTPVENPEALLDRKLKKIADPEVRRSARGFLIAEEGTKGRDRIVAAQKNVLRDRLAKSSDPD